VAAAWAAVPLDRLKELFNLVSAALAAAAWAAVASAAATAL
jgi:hypothetical protein